MSAAGWRRRRRVGGGRQPQQLQGVVAERARFELANRVTPVTAFPVPRPRPDYATAPRALILEMLLEILQDPGLPRQPVFLAPPPVAVVRLDHAGVGLARR